MKDSIMNEILTSPTNSDEGNTVSSNKEIPEDEKGYSKEDMVSLVLSNKTVGEKYKQKMLDMALKDPDSVRIKDKKGGKFKTLAQAMEDGTIPGVPPKPDIKGMMKDHSPEEQEQMMKMLDPSTTDMSEEELAKLGFKEGQGRKFREPAKEKAPAPAPTEGEQPPVPGGDALAAMMGGLQ